MTRKPKHTQAHRSELTTEFLSHVIGCVDSWAAEKNPLSIRERLSGLAFSILAAIDGEGGETCLDLVAHYGPGESYVLTDGFMLHGLFVEMDKFHQEDKLKALFPGR
jgi:hypothetical protein